MSSPLPGHVPSSPPAVPENPSIRESDTEIAQKKGTWTGSKIVEVTFRDGTVKQYKITVRNAGSEDAVNQLMNEQKPKLIALAMVQSASKNQGSIEWKKDTGYTQIFKTKGLLPFIKKSNSKTLSNHLDIERYRTKVKLYKTIQLLRDDNLPEKMPEEQKATFKEIQTRGSITKEILEKLGIDKKYFTHLPIDIDQKFADDLDAKVGRWEKKLKLVEQANIICTQASRSIPADIPGGISGIDEGEEIDEEDTGSISEEKIVVMDDDEPPVPSYLPPDPPEETPPAKIGPPIPKRPPPKPPTVKADD